jgi:hypothetical protein
MENLCDARRIFRPVAEGVALCRFPVPGWEK